MFIHEFGNRDDPTVILLAPMMVSGTDLYALMSRISMALTISSLLIRADMARRELIRLQTKSTEN